MTRLHVLTSFASPRFRKFLSSAAIRALDHGKLRCNATISMDLSKARLAVKRQPPAALIERWSTLMRVLACFAFQEVVGLLDKIHKTAVFARAVSDPSSRWPVT